MSVEKISNQTKYTEYIIDQDVCLVYWKGTSEKNWKHLRIKLMYMLKISLHFNAF